MSVEIESHVWKNSYVTT